MHETKLLSSENDVVISGISGRFPKSDNMNEFSNNLYNKVDMIDDDETRWKHHDTDVPKRSGKINILNKFDSSFFSIHNRLANATESQGRILLEASYEAILDAGISPQSIIGSRTGVFIGSSVDNSNNHIMMRVQTKDGNGLIGNANFNLANRISFALGLCGPSLVIDTACSSSGYALELAYKNIQDGICDAALVGGSHVITNMETTLDFFKLKVLSADGHSCPFDKKACGFTRGEAICALFLQKQKFSKRVYAKLVQVKCNNDGFKPEGTVYPSRIMQQKLFEECFSSLNINPNDVGYVEAHATSTSIGDAEEVAAIDEAYCKNRKQPLLIGSLKSNMGHAEGASTVSSIAKIVLAFENQLIPPNINLSELRDDIPAFAEGRINVVTDVTKLETNFIGINSFGLGGANFHAIFQGNTKAKVNNGTPSDDLNRLICWAGRTESALHSVFDDVASRPLDAEHVALLQNSQVKTAVANIYRGYGIFSNEGSSQKAVCVQRNIKHFNSGKKPVVWVYSGMGSQWLGMGKDLMEIPTFSKSIERCHAVLALKGLNLIDIITSTKEKILDEVLHSYVAIVSIEIALTDVLKSLGMEPDFIIGHSVGELGCSYCDGCFTAEETILAAYARGLSSKISKNIAGAMAAVGLGPEEVLTMLPGDIDIACHNAVDSTTVSGPEASVKAFVAKLSEQNIFVREVASSGIALHSRYIKDMGENLHKMLSDVIKAPRRRSAKWLSSTYAFDEWNLEESKYSSADYHTKNLLSPVLFREVLEKLPECLTIEVAPHGLLKSILKRALKESKQVSLTQRDSADGVLHLMNALGEIFQNGVDFDVAKLYPSVEFPVSRGTPMIAPIIKWDHSQDLDVNKFEPSEWWDKRRVAINISDKKFSYLQGHVIDGKILLPGASTIFLVWETFAMLNSMKPEECSVTFEDVKLLRVTLLQKQKDVIVTIKIHNVSGAFEVSEGSSNIATGIIRLNEHDRLTDVAPTINADSIKIGLADFYKELSLRGYQHKDEFCGILESRIDGLKGKVKWNNNWTTFLDTMTHLLVLTTDLRVLYLPNKIRKITIDPILHFKMLKETLNGELDIVVGHTFFRAGGVEMSGYDLSPVNRRRQVESPVLEVYKFFPHIGNTPVTSNIDAAKFSVQHFYENSPTKEICVVEFDAFDAKEPLAAYFRLAVKDLPIVTSNINYITNVEDGIETSIYGLEELGRFADVSIVVKSQCMNDVEFLKIVSKIMHPNGLILSRENLDSNEAYVADGLQIVARITTDRELIVVLQFIKDDVAGPDKIIRITLDVEEWLEPLKEAVKTQSVLIYSQNYPTSGILGLFNCLKREPGIKLVCLFICDPKAPPFDVNLRFYKDQLKKGFAVNVVKNGMWGSYKHLEMREDIKRPRSGHYYVNSLSGGNISSLSWTEGNISHETIHADPQCVKIKYSALNFRDVMQASGKLHFKDVGRIQQQCVLGLEFSGVMKDGKRVMGISTPGSIATYFEAEKSLIWDVPESWSLEEAATVPMAYTTVLLSFFYTAKIKTGQSVLIHAGSGAVGTAALHIAFHHGLEVYTTVSTQEKKDFLMKSFPLLKEQNIGNSRDTSFERIIEINTKGQGVDYVLNSLAGDLLLASIRCVAKNGTFLEIGRYDILNKTKIDLGFLDKNIKIKAIMVDINERNKIVGVHQMFKELLHSGVIKPLKTTVFEANEVQNAFRFLASGKHIGKVLVKVRENDIDDESLPILVRKQIFFDESASYIIVGGLGGMGLELADWLVLRGCKKLVMSSSRGVTNDYQAYRIKTWESYGVKVVVSRSNVTNEKGCKELIEEAMLLGPVFGIFNLANVLRDGIFINQNTQMFNESLAPKAMATEHLDKISRELCPQIKHFVIFSSISCGRGNAGQSNYGLANSVMERIIEDRHVNKLPAKAIQWGVVGDVGLLAGLQEDIAVGGSLPQRIESCIEILDTLLTCDDPVVSSTVIAEKRVLECKNDGVIETLLNILGIQDRKTVSLDSPLSKLGLDSLMTAEILQLLECEFSLFITSKELQSMSLVQLQQKAHLEGVARVAPDNFPKKRNFATVLPQILLYNMLNQRKAEDKTIVSLQGSTDKSIKILLIPGIEGIIGYMDNFVNSFKCNVSLLQINRFPTPETIKELHDFVIEDVLKFYEDCQEFHLIGSCFGSCLALELAKSLEDCGKIGKVVMIEGSPLYIHRIYEKNAFDQENFLNIILKRIIMFDFPNRHLEIVKSLSGLDWDTKLIKFWAHYDSTREDDKNLTKKQIGTLINRITMVRIIHQHHFPIVENTKIFLIKASQKLADGMEEDYSLSQYSKQSVDTYEVDGNHFAISDNPKLLSWIHQSFGF